MKREIKFRFWQTIEKFMLNWDEINLSSLYELLTAADSIPMQFTGLTDKNGKEIYEGDLVELKTNYHTQDRRFGWQKVEIFFENLQYLCKNNLGQIYDLLEETDKGSYCWEVVGNIYENPELL